MFEYVFCGLVLILFAVVVYAYSSCKCPCGWVLIQLRFLFQINPNSKAYNEGIKVGDIIDNINGQKTHGLNYADAQQLIKNSTEQLQLDISRLVGYFSS